jgi:phage terminase small subunit
MARRKITEQQAPTAAAELPELTVMQQKFVEGILAGKTASDAYRAAYTTENMLSSTIWVKASELRNNEKVQVWLAAARMAGLGSATVTYEGHLRELERLREIALKSGNIGAAVQAEQLRGKVAGHHVDQIRDVTERHDPAQTIREIAVHSPELAASLAAANGIEFNPAEGLTKH